MYAQVFLLLNFFKQRDKVKPTVVPHTLTEYPTITIIVPCWNEEKTVVKTVQSLLSLDYPKDKITIKIIDDGSTDATWEIIQQFASCENVELIHKENGGKHTAMNLGIETATSEFISCLDADAFVNPDALKKMMTYFADSTVMSVSPSILVYQPATIYQKAQKVEYDMSVFVKKILGIISGIHVSPGPFSVYRKKVFDDLGLYRKAHNTEDMEIAYRMQVHGYKIEQCHDAYVYTVTPRTFKTLFKQRLRWIYGFINNSLDYRSYLFKPQYGAFSLFTVPAGMIALIGGLFGFFFITISFIRWIVTLIEHLQVINFSFAHISAPHFELFFINTSPMLFVMIILYTMLLGIILYGQKLSDQSPMPKMSLFYFMVVYTLMSPFWLIKAVYNTAFSRETSWR